MISDTMKAITIARYGRTKVLDLSSVPVPKPKADQVLVKVHAASINPRDWLLMRGLYPFKKFAEPFPITLGSDMSGTIVAIGSAVSSYKIGDSVFGMQPIRGKFGAFAEYIAIKETAVALKPSKISHQQAAAMPCAGMTSYQALKELARLRASETILINGASGGVGSYAVQMAKAIGATVVAVCGPTNRDLCLDLGADRVIDYKEENFETHTNQYDVVYDVIGRSSLARSKKALKSRGRYITTIPSPSAAISAAISKITALNPFSKRLTSHLILVAPKGTDLAEMADLMVAGKIKSIIDTEYNLDQAGEAFERSQSWRSRGKLIFNIGA